MHKHMRTSAVLGTLIFALLNWTLPAVADDWAAIKLRGYVFALPATSADDWQRIDRDAVVSDGGYIRTLSSGHVVFEREAETVSFLPNTQGRIVDRTGQRYTTVHEDFGEVSIEADVKNVKHFAVETPYLVAVVKGTVFTVSTDKTGSRVVVKRGMVEVSSRVSNKTIRVPAGQQVKVGTDGKVAVTGKIDRQRVHGVVNGIVEDAEGKVDTLVGDLTSTVSTTVDSTVNGTLGKTVGNLVSGLGL